MTNDEHSNTQQGFGTDPNQPEPSDVPPPEPKQVPLPIPDGEDDPDSPEETPTRDT